MRSINNYLYRSMLVFPVFLTLILVSCSKEQVQQDEQPENGDKEAYPIVVQVSGMYCTLCSSNIERSFKELDEVEAVTASVSEKQVKIRLKDNRALTKVRITNIIADAGYEPGKFIKYPEDS